jgi:hypothetical protein
MKTQDIKNMALAFQAVTEKYGKKKEDAYNDARPGTKQNQKDFDKASKMAAPKDKVSLKPMPASLAQKMKSEELKGGQHKLDHDSVEEAVDLEMHKKAAADHAAKAKAVGNKWPKGAEHHDNAAEAHQHAINMHKKFGPDHSGTKNAVAVAKNASNRAADGGKGHKAEGLWDNIRKRREAGKPKLKPGDKGYPKTLNIESVEEAFEPHMMYDPKTGKGYKAEKEADHLRMKKMGYTHDKPATNEALKGDQHKLDHDKDGDSDAADFKGLRNKNKKDKKSEIEVKPNQKQDDDKGAVAEKAKCSSSYKKESTELENLETQVEQTYQGVQSGMRQAMIQMWEKASHTGGAPAEEIDSKDSPTAKKMKADHKAEVNDVEEKGHVDAAQAGRAGPSAKARPNDNMKGDKAIINPVKGK